MFNIEFVNYCFIKKNGLFLVGTSRIDNQPSFTVEIINRIAKEIKDFVGVITEESIRKNFILIYEILDEMIDFG